MALDQTTLTKEIQQIANNGANPVHFNWSAQILANGVKIIPIKILNIDLKRLYDVNYSDEMIMEFTIGEGTFEHQIYPYKDNLLVTLIKTPLEEVGTSSALTTQDIENHQLRGTLITKSSAVIEGNNPNAQSQQAADLGNIKTVQIQLVDLALEQIRMKSAGGVVRKSTPGDALKFFMTQLSQDLKVDAVNAIKGVDMVDPSNTEMRNHVMIPHGLPFAEVPGYIHEHCGGIYNAGMGFYLQGGHWYVYPQHNTQRWQTTPKNLTMINVPKNRLPGTERTYRMTGNQLIILVTGDTKHQDSSDHQQLNKGNGVRFADANKILAGFVKVVDNKMTALRSLNNSEFIAIPRKTGLNNVQTSKTKITSNNFVELGKLAPRQGSMVMGVWQNSDTGAIYPGMPVKYIYTVNDQVIEVYGCVLRVEHYIALAQSGPSTKRYTCNTAITAFIDNTITWDNSQAQPSP